MNGLDLFSGIGGLALALAPWVRPIAYCEKDQYAQSVLLSRMSDGALPAAPIWDDVQTLTGAMLPPIEFIAAGFPCTDISSAGRGAGLGGEHSRLFFEVVRLVQETRPTFVFLENVPSIRSRGLREVIRAFSDLRYDMRWTSVSAAEVGAPHIRRRWFMLAADTNGEPIRNEQQRLSWRRERELQHEGKAQSSHDGSEGSLADSHGSRLAISGGSSESDRKRFAPDSRRWEAEPAGICRVVDGLPYRVDRLKCLGNAVVPAQAKEAFERLAGLKLANSITA